MKRKRIDDIYSPLLNQLNSELSVSHGNNRYIQDIYEQGLAVIDGYRTAQKYEWQSDVIVPEYFSSFITEQSLISNQYFSTRDFVEIYLEGDKPEDKLKCEAAKRLINKLLNRRELYHYQKLMRASAIRQLAGVVYFLCWWEQEVYTVPTTTNIPQVTASEDYTMSPQMFSIPQTTFREEIRKDWFNYEVIDPRNAFVSPEYTYSLQDKQYVIIRHEKDLASLIADAKRCNYFNIDKLKELKPQTITETASESYNKEQNASFPHNLPSPIFDVYERYGKYWAVVKETDNYGIPTKITPGIDISGNPLDNAVLIETVITFVKSGGESVLIRFEPQRNVDYRHRPYRPIIRGLYYIHPSRSEGMTDTNHSINLQEAVNDTINISNDRVMLATFPAFKARKYSFDDVSELYIAPDHPILLDDPNSDLQELKITDNIQGAMLQTNLLINQLQQLRAIFPTTMGNLGSVKSSMTATAVAGAENRTDIRQSFKAMCFEYTTLSEFYWMMLQMAYQYMREETAREIFGEELMPYFSPDADYTFKPVTSAIEQEQSKQMKIRNYTQILQTVANVRHPDTVKVVNYILTEILKLMGQEYSIIQTQLMNPQQPMQYENQAQAPQSPPTSNQYGLNMNPIDQMIRGVKK